MSKKSAQKSQEQEVRAGRADSGKRKGVAPEALVSVMQQLVLPLVVGIESTKNGLLAFVHQIGLLAMQELFAIEAAAIAGAKGKHAKDRDANHWGMANVVFPFGGRHLVVEVPRVRRKGKGKQEVELPSVVSFRQRCADPRLKPDNRARVAARRRCPVVVDAASYAALAACRWSRRASAAS